MFIKAMSHLTQSVKNRCSVRCDSSESCDSGLVCSDTSSCSSCSDVSEPISPSSSQSPRSDIAESVTSPRADESETNLPDFLKPTGQPCDMKLKQPSFLIPELITDVLQSVEAKSHNYRRKRRHSESFDTSLTEQNFLNEERHRRFSGDVVFKTSAIKEDIKGTVYSKRVNYENRTEEIEPALKSPFQSLRSRMSWPLFSRRSISEQTRNGQTKITEYFSNQVKQKWTFLKLNSASKRLPSKTIDTSFTSQPTIVQDCERLAVETQNSGCSTVETLSDVSESNDIRFPTLKTFPDNKSQRSGEVPNEDILSHCKWLDCNARLSSGQSLLEHIQTAHVASQYRKSGWKPSKSTSLGNNASNDVYVCQWEGCKVQGRSSSSRAWLERHVLLHGGHKPFLCIVDSCEQRFSSQVALQRHVNAHLNQGTCGANQTNVIKREISSKIARRNAKKLRNRISKVSPARLFDYFDVGVMERLRHQLLFSQLSQKQCGLVFANGKITLKSEVIARRLDDCGKARVLLRWYPENIALQSIHSKLQDQWVMENEVLTSRTIPLHDINHATRLQLGNVLNNGSAAGEKRRRK